MLRSMRRHAKYFYVLFVLVILSFIFWGVGSVDKSTGVPVASVGKDKISADEYWRAYERSLDLAKEVYKEKFDSEMEKKLGLRKKVLDNLIDERVLARAAVEAGIKVGDQEVEDSITKDPTFQRDGAFSRDIYLRTLDLNRVTPQAYESAKRRDLLIEKMVRLITEPVELTPGEFKEIEGDEALNKELRDLLLNDKREKAFRSFVEGLRKGTDIKVNTDLVEG